MEKVIQQFDFEMMGEIWHIILQDPDDFYKQEDSDAMAITDADQRIVRFQTPELKFEYVVHEITHVYRHYQLRGHTDNVIDDPEEYLCEFNGRYAYRIVKDSEEIFKRLGGNIETDPTFYKGV